MTNLRKVDFIDNTCIRYSSPPVHLLGPAAEEERTVVAVKPTSVRLFGVGEPLVPEVGPWKGRTTMGESG